MIPTKDEISNAARTAAQIESPTVQVLAQHYFKRGADWAISQNSNNAIVMRRFFVCGYCGNEVNAYGIECSSPDFDKNNVEIIEGTCCVEGIRYGSF